MNPETRAYLASARRDAACSQASSRREGAGDGSPEITTPEKLRHLQDALYRKAKAEANYRFWSLYGELIRRDLLEHALRLEASARSQQRLREAVRTQLNHWTLGKRIPEAMSGLNRLLRGWSGYFHYRQSSRVMGKLNWQVRDRVRRWLWRKHGKKRALWSDYPDERLRDPYGLWSLPQGLAWRRAWESGPNAL